MEGRKEGREGAREGGKRKEGERRKGPGTGREGGSQGRKERKEKEEKGQAWWLTPVIPALWKVEVVDHLKSGV